MAHFIVRKKGKTLLYQYPRRNNGRLYESRTTHGPDAEQARVFNTKGAATRSNEGWGEVVEVELRVKDGEEGTK